MRLQVALDARPLTTSRAGVATYCRGLVHGLNVAAHDERVVLYAGEPAPPRVSPSYMRLATRGRR